MGNIDNNQIRDIYELKLYRLSVTVRLRINNQKVVMLEWSIIGNALNCNWIVLCIFEQFC